MNRLIDIIMNYFFWLAKRLTGKIMSTTTYQKSKHATPTKNKPHYSQ